MGVQALAIFEDVAFGRRQVQSINPSGTYNLDCKPDVPPDRISAKSDTGAIQQFEIKCLYKFHISMVQHIKKALGIAIDK